MTSLDDFLIIKGCLADGCELGVKALGLCNRHLQATRRAGCTEEAKARVQALIDAASCEACGGPIRSRKHALCEKHYGRVRRNGTLERVTREPNGTCHLCGDPAPPRRVYCSDRCSWRSARGLDAEQASVTCPLCDRERPARSDAQFCSRTCTARAGNLRFHYGMSVTEYRAMLAAQDDRCAICREAPKRAFHVDHDHTTGIVRALLCGPCNSAIGHLRDDPKIAEAAARFLHEHAAG